MELIRPSATRWLSYQKSVENIKKSYEAVLISLQKEVDERKCAKANGLLKRLQKWKCVYTIEMLDKVLPCLARLSKMFQVKTKKKTRNAINTYRKRNI